MKQVLNFITLGVRDLEAMKAFYRDTFGWTIMSDTGDIVFFQLNGLILGLFPAGELAKDIGVPQDGQGFRSFSLAINFPSEAEVDAVFGDMRAKGATIVKPPQQVFWGGYSGYIADPEGNYWEFACNPFIRLDAAGSIAAGQ